MANASDLNYKGAGILVLRGLPRSGKSTVCRDCLSVPDPDGSVIVSRDSIRYAVTGERFVEAAEPTVHKVWKAMVSALLYSGHRQIMLDGCFCPDAYVNEVETEWPEAEVATLWNVTHPLTCKQRAIACGQPDLLPVIDRYASQVPDWVKELWSSEDLDDDPWVLDYRGKWPIKS